MLAVADNVLAYGGDFQVIFRTTLTGAAIHMFMYLSTDAPRDKVIQHIRYVFAALLCVDIKSGYIAVTVSDATHLISQDCGCHM
jgi:hypothetical protein